MTTPAKFSTRNVANSIATKLAERLVAHGYLIYWHELDSVETPDGWYYDYAAQQDTYLADSIFAARIDEAKGLLNLRRPLTAIPRLLTRPIVDGRVGGADEVPIPAVAVEVKRSVPIENAELGTALKRRHRHLVIEAFARDPDEQDQLADLLGVWFDNDTEITVLDHDAGTLATVGNVRFDRVVVDSLVTVDDAEAATFYVVLNAFLEYYA
jgi:hypothetical protein